MYWNRRKKIWKVKIRKQLDKKSKQINKDMSQYKTEEGETKLNKQTKKKRNWA